MEDNYRTRKYLKEMEAVKIETVTRLSTDWLPSFIMVFTRDYYRKRNNKKCYVDTNHTKIVPDMSRIKSGRFHNITSTGENDWNPVVNKGVYYKLDKDYKEELLNTNLKQLTS